MQRQRGLVVWLKLRYRHVGSGVDPCQAGAHSFRDAFQSSCSPSNPCLYMIVVP